MSKNLPLRNSKLKMLPKKLLRMCLTFLSLQKIPMKLSILRIKELKKRLFNKSGMKKQKK
tara:strand:- start:128 stop:307 length:180 start_codon:yes stop_codon:yes gene_type:complete